MPNLILKLCEINKSNQNLAGGKGASLGEMLNSGINVPDGFVVTTNAYNKLDDNLKNQIYKYFDELDCQYVAVRSSANCEDSADNSFAGQFDTFLNTTRENLIENIQKCWDSLNSDRCQAYLKEKEIKSTSVKIAVVIQKMIQSEIAGVAFCLNPVTNDTNQIMIEAGYGLGEAVVSGQITPDNYLISKHNLDKLEIIETNISTQTRGLYNHEGSNAWNGISENLQSKQKLTDTQILELAKLCTQIEQHYGFPCDIEWALFENVFYITQSRPVTTIEEIEINADLEEYKNKKIINRIKKIEWIKLADRPNYPFMIPPFLSGLSSDYFGSFGFDGIEYDVLFQDGAIFYNQKKYTASLAKITELLKTKSIFWMTASLNEMHGANKSQVAKLANSDIPIGQKIQETLEIIKKYSPFLFITTLLETHFENRGKLELQDLANKFTDGDTNNFIVKIAISEKKTIYEKMNEYIRNGLSVVEIHQKYAWTKSRDGFTDFYTLGEIEDIVKSYVYKEIESFETPKELVEIAKEYGELIFFRTDRTEKLYEILGLFRPILKEIAAFYSLEFQDLAYYYSN